jgi:hypothetical protein
MWSGILFVFSGGDLVAGKIFEIFAKKKSKKIENALTMYY